MAQLYAFLRGHLLACLGRQSTYRVGIYIGRPLSLRVWQRKAVRRLIYLFARLATVPKAMNNTETTGEIQKGFFHAAWGAGGTPAAGYAGINRTQR